MDAQPFLPASLSFFRASALRCRFFGRAGLPVPPSAPMAPSMAASLVP
jgi:hypothetical protein